MITLSHKKKTNFTILLEGFFSTSPNCHSHQLTKKTIHLEMNTWVTRWVDDVFITVFSNFGLSVGARNEKRKNFLELFRYICKELSIRSTLSFHMFPFEIDFDGQVWLCSRRFLLFEQSWIDVFQLTECNSKSRIFQNVLVIDFFKSNTKNVNYQEETTRWQNGWLTDQKDVNILWFEICQKVTRIKILLLSCCKFETINTDRRLWYLNRSLVQNIVNV